MVAPQQAQRDNAEIHNLPPISAHLYAQGVQQPAGLGRWMVAIVSGLALTALGVVMLPDGKEAASPWMRRQEPEMEPSPVDILARQLRQVPAGNVDARRTLHASMGHIFRDRGRYREAAQHYKEASELAAGATDKSVALQHLGLVEMHLGHLTSAALLLSAALAAGGGDQAESSVGVLHTIGDVKLQQGKIAEAIREYTRAYSIAVQHRDLDESILLLADIGEAWARKGHVEEAFKWMQKASEQLEVSRTSAQGVTELVAAKVSSYLGSAYHLKGNVAKAMDLYHKAMRVQAKSLRPSHSDLLATRVSMARAQRDMGDSDGAMRAIEAIEKTSRNGPNEGPDLSRVLVLKSDMLREAKQTRVAEDTAKEAIRLQSECYGSEDHPEIAVAIASYGGILHDSGKFAEAREKYEEALKMNQMTVGMYHPETASVYNSMGTLFQDISDPVASFGQFTKCLEIQRRTVGETSPDVANTYNNMATVLFQQGRSEEAAGLLKKAIQILDATSSPKLSPERLLYEENLEEVLKSAGSADGSAASITADA
mmetsp:Transcript_61532/g.156306  ORF Transcript_61532/g.156306 Transcript_61532/m.156306 type:complete len:541 (-) Transcript_61532:60-1682(-)|eukprot:CAMPEP_0183429514 /NCGR_PEP_ID=MMETSP0370-20130417/48921_1 /TAXON_ID=268820 /ORGANISM="Peridinium aciculiferum, Strain PAER-2" /LENGTH=540 /DNA_ID=CAMNT_0025614577 /DNA_START=107 /DNA_END=1729 /DNA_ORIENTATION=+